MSGASQLRLESYLFTEESITEARNHLTEDGVFAMYNYYREPWLINRLAGTVDQVFGHQPCLDEFTAYQSLAAITVGKNADNAVCAEGAVWDRAAVAAAGQDTPVPAVDDRPFLYLKERTIPNLYLIVIVLILAVSLIGIRVFGGPFRTMRGYGDLFFMGAAFLLLETRSITTFALLFGTTWLVNALVFTGVLLAVLAAIEVTQRVKRDIPRPLIITALFVSLGDRVPDPELVTAEPARPAAAPRRDGPGVRPDLLREPAVHVEVQGLREPDGGIRGEPVRRDGRRLPGVPVPGARLPVPAGRGGAALPGSGPHRTAADLEEVVRRRRRLTTAQGRSAACAIARRAPSAAADPVRFIRCRTLSAQANSVASTATPSAISTRPGPGRTSRITPTTIRVPPTAATPIHRTGCGSRRH